MHIGDPFGRQRRAWPHAADSPHFHVHRGKIGQFFKVWVSPGTNAGLCVDSPQNTTRDLQNTPGTPAMHFPLGASGSQSALYTHFFYEKSFSAQLDFPPSRTAKKAPKPTWVCFHCCRSALATVFQLPQPWTPICPFFYEKNLFRPSLILHRQEQPKRRPKPPGLASIATAVLWQQYFNCHNHGQIERN